jgi:uncharacterized protein (DUF433 family)
MRWQEYIERRPDVLCGKPVFKGTRIAVQMILEDRAAGATESEMLRSYPTLRSEHLRAADDYAARLIGDDESIFLADTGS